MASAGGMGARSLQSVSVVSAAREGREAAQSASPAYASAELGALSRCASSGVFRCRLAMVAAAMALGLGVLLRGSLVVWASLRNHGSMEVGLNSMD